MTKTQSKDACDNFSDEAMLPWTEEELEDWYNQDYSVELDEEVLEDIRLLF